MVNEEESLLWLSLGGLGAMALGVALIPLRGVTSASNLAFVFLAFTIVVAELGGRGAALVAALVSAMSLNFFLTEPYLTLVITKMDDIIAFFALATCGLIAAAFGRRRQRASTGARRARASLEVIDQVVTRLRSGEPLDRALGDLRRCLGVSCVALRNPEGDIMAVTPPEAFPPPARAVLDAMTLVAASEIQPGRRGIRLPAGGAKIALAARDQPLGWLELWNGRAEGFDRDESRVVSIAVSLFESALASRVRR